MKIRLQDAGSTHDLGEFLRSRIDAVVEERNDQLEVSLIGSYGESAMRDEIEHAVRSWSLLRQRPAPPVELD